MLDLVPNWRRGENQSTRRKTSPSKDKNQQLKLNPFLTRNLVIEPGPHWWEVSALTTAPSQLSILSNTDILAKSCLVKSCFKRRGVLDLCAWPLSVELTHCHNLFAHTSHNVPSQCYDLVILNWISVYWKSLQKVSTLIFFLYSWDKCLGRNKGKHWKQEDRKSESQHFKQDALMTHRQKYSIMHAVRLFTMCIEMTSCRNILPKWL